VVGATSSEGSLNNFESRNFCHALETCEITERLEYAVFIYRLNDYYILWIIFSSFKPL